MRQNNKWRRRIIRVLETLLEDLQSRPPSPKQLADIHKLANLPDDYSGIEVAESFYYWKVMTIPKTKDRVIYKLKDCLEDTAFKVFCSLQDATYIRLYSARAWREFALGDIGVQTATLVTNGAIGLLIKLSKYFRGMFDHLLDGDWEVRIHTAIDQFMRRHIASDIKYEDTRPDSINPAFEDVSLARHATRKLGFYASTLQCSQLSNLLSKAFGSDEALDTSSLSLEESRLLKSIAQVRCLEYLHDQASTTFKDNYIFNAAMALVHGLMDPCAVFAAQMLYDIQQEIDLQNEPLEDIVEAVTLDFLSKYDNYSAEWKQETPYGNRPARVRLMEGHQSFLRHMAYSENTIHDELGRFEDTIPGQQTIPEFNIVRHVPLLMGQLIYRYHECFHECFLDIANRYGFILTAMHLYNAAKESGSLPVGAYWADMELIIDSQVKHNPFPSSSADSGTKFLKNFCDAYSLKSDKFTISHKLTHPEQVRNDVFQADGSPNPLESHSLYIKVSSEIAIRLGSKITDLSYPKLQALADYQLDALSVHGTPHTIGILIAAKEVCEVDEEALAFDIFGLHMTCKKLLSSIRNACFADDPDDYPAIRCDGTEGLNTTIAELLRDLVDCPRHHGRMWPKAMEILADVIRQEGSACEKTACESLNMTTMDSVCMDSDGPESRMSSARSVLGDSMLKTPSTESMDVDEPQLDSGRSGASLSRSRDDGEDLPAPSKRPKLESSGRPSRVDSDRPEEWHHQQQETIRELSNLRVEQSPSVHYLVAPTDRTLASWAPEEGPRMMR